MLAINGVSRRFPNGTTALDGINLTLNQGDFLALLGPSGCGKSTLLRLIAGLDAPDSGTLRWDGPRPQVGYVFQDPTLLPWATAAENVWLPLRLRGLSRTAAQPAIAAALAQVGLSDFAHSRPRELSGGMRMRVSLARALVAPPHATGADAPTDTPRLLLMDEPFAALDEFTRHRLQDDLLALWQRTGATIVFVTHSIYEAAFLARRVALMTPRPGRIAQTIASPLAPVPETRLTPAYTDFVATLTATLRATAAA